LVLIFNFFPGPSLAKKLTPDILVSLMNHHMLVEGTTQQLGLRYVLDLIAKRLDNLKHRKYFPSHSEIDSHAAIAASSVTNSAALAATRAAESANTASKSAIAAAAACQSAFAATMKLTSLQKNTAVKNTAGMTTAGINTAGMITAG